MSRYLVTGTLVGYSRAEVVHRQVTRSSRVARDLDGVVIMLTNGTSVYLKSKSLGRYEKSGALDPAWSPVISRIKAAGMLEGYVSMAKVLDYEQFQCELTERSEDVRNGQRKDD